MSGAAKLIAISSDWGSVSLAPGTAYSYCSSKAALNSIMRGMSRSWIKDNITIVMVHSGWTRSFVGGDEAPTSADENAVGVGDGHARLRAGPRHDLEQDPTLAIGSGRT